MESEKVEKEHYEKLAFILAWSASIWKRIWRCAYVYCEHQNKEVTSDIILKCLKYNLLCPTGIVSQMVPSLETALSKGFLMPKEYENNEYVKRAVRLFGDAYKIAKIEGEEEQKKEIINFISSFAATISQDKEESKKKEIGDILSKVDKKGIFYGAGHKCNFCDLVEAWDINLSLYIPPTQLHALLLCSLLKILESSTK